MSIKIQDGTGSGRLAFVDDNNRLHVASSQRSDFETETLYGVSFNFNSLSISFTGSASTAVSYMKNTGTGDIIIKEFICNLGTSISGSGDSTVEIIRNPSAGTVISAARSVTPANINFGSSKTSSVLAYTGSYGETFTDGTTILAARLKYPERHSINLESVVLRNGSSVGLRYTPPSSNISQNCIFAIRYYERNIT